MATKQLDKGKITEITFSKTIQVNQYEPERVEIKSTVGSNEEPEAVFDYLKGLAEFLLLGDRELPDDKTK